jgi:hypothetical protein
LVYNSNLLMYDCEIGASEDATPQAKTDASLWSQLLAKPVSGAAVSRNNELRVLPAQLVTWGDWSRRHPQTSVLNRDLRMAARYKDAAPLAYFKSPHLLENAVVRPLPDRNSLAFKTHVIAVRVNDQRRVFKLSDLLNYADASGVCAVSVASTMLRFRCDRESHTAFLENDAPDDGITAVISYWFAWHAMHPDDAIYDFENQRDSSSS